MAHGSLQVPVEVETLPSHWGHSAWLHFLTRCQAVQLWLHHLTANGWISCQSDIISLESGALFFWLLAGRQVLFLLSNSFQRDQWIWPLFIAWEIKFAAIQGFLLHDLDYKIFHKPCQKFADLTLFAKTFFFNWRLITLQYCGGVKTCLKKLHLHFFTKDPTWLNQSVIDKEGLWEINLVTASLWYFLEPIRFCQPYEVWPAV